MPAIYTRADLRSALNRRLHNKLGVLADANATIEDAVREVTGRLDLRSMKRKAQLAPHLFNDIYQYHWPVDAKGRKIISIQPQDQERNWYDNWALVDEDEFDRYKETRFNMVAFSHNDMTTKLLLSVNNEYAGFVVSPLDSLAGSNTWTAFGDATGLDVDLDYYMTNQRSVKFNISDAGGTTAGIQSSNLQTFDLTRIYNYGSAFVWAWITDPTNITNFKLRIGTNSTNYYEMTAIATNEGASFQTGWNLIRFDFSGKQTILAPTVTTGNYVAIFMTKSVGKINETDYRFDSLRVKYGKIRNIVYYSRYPWISSNGLRLVRATATDNSDKIICEEDEYNLIMEKLVELGGLEAREYDDANRAAAKYELLVKEYRRNYKSEALTSQSTYYDF